jgi:hypothetical protein
VDKEEFKGNKKITHEEIVVHLDYINGEISEIKKTLLRIEKANSRQNTKIGDLEVDCAQSRSNVKILFWLIPIAFGLCGGLVAGILQILGMR